MGKVGMWRWSSFPWTRLPELVCRPSFTPEGGALSTSAIFPMQLICSFTHKVAVSWSNRTDPMVRNILLSGLQGVLTPPFRPFC